MHHFPWLRNRTTEHRKAGKARNTKENRRSKEFNTVSKLLVAHLSSPRDNLERSDNEEKRSFFESISQKEQQTPKTQCFRGFLYLTENLVTILFGEKRDAAVSKMGRSPFHPYLHCESAICRSRSKDRSISCWA